jgi:hypothetical protein
MKDKLNKVEWTGWAMVAAFCLGLIFGAIIA